MNWFCNNHFKGKFYEEIILFALLISFSSYAIVMDNGEIYESNTKKTIRVCSNVMNNISDSTESLSSLYKKRQNGDKCFYYVVQKSPSEGIYFYAFDANQKSDVQYEKSPEGWKACIQFN